MCSKALFLLWKQGTVSTVLDCITVLIFVALREAPPTFSGWGLFCQNTWTGGWWGMVTADWAHLELQKMPHLHLSPVFELASILLYLKGFIDSCFYSCGLLGRRWAQCSLSQIVCVIVCVSRDTQTITAWYVNNWPVEPMPSNQQNVRIWGHTRSPDRGGITCPRSWFSYTEEITSNFLESWRRQITVVCLIGTVTSEPYCILRTVSGTEGGYVWATSYGVSNTRKSNLHEVMATLLMW